MPPKRTAKTKAKPKPIKSVRFFILAWLGLAAVFGALLAPLNMPRIVRILGAEATAEGKITGTECANHASVFYIFEYNGDPHMGRESMGDRCFTAKKGDKITVWFASNAPDINSANAPQSDLLNELLSIVSVMILFPPLILWGASDIGKKVKPVRKKTAAKQSKQSL